MTTEIGYRRDIDGLRGVAVLAVLVYHAFPRMAPGGYTGVDVFFVISGYLISGIVLKQLAAGKFSVPEFYRRRIRRIFPALSLVLAVCLLAGYFTLFPAEYRQIAKHTVAAAVFLSNITLYREAGYFDTASHTKPLLHLWSLGIEEQFYLFWPLCLAIIFRRRNLLLICAGLALLSFALNVVLTNTNQSAAFYLPFSRIWELLFGCMLAVLALQRGGKASVSRESRLSDILSLLGAASMIAGLALLTKYSPFPGFLALLPSAGSALVILAGEGAVVNRVVLRSRLLVWFGLISYPLYLWHWPILCFARILLWRSDLDRMFLVVLSISLAWLTYRFVERPIRMGKFRLDVKLLPAALAGTALAGLCIMAAKGLPERAGMRSPSALENDLQHYETAGLSVCTSSPGDADLCAQSQAGPATAAVVGDSHAHALFQGLANADHSRNWLLFGQSGCPPALGITVQNGGSHCAEHMQAIFEHVAALPALKQVVLSFYGYYAETADALEEAPMTPSRFRLICDPGEDKEAALEHGLERAIGLLLSRGKRVLIVLDVPELPFLPQDCVSRPFRLDQENCSVPLTAVAQRQQRIRRIVGNVGSKFAGVRIFDPLSVVCTTDPCKPVGTATALYRDNNHLSIRGSELVAKAMLPIIAGL